MCTMTYSDYLAFPILMGGFALPLFPFLALEAYRLRKQARHLAFTATLALAFDFLSNVFVFVDMGMFPTAIVFFTLRIVFMNLMVTKLAVFFITNSYALMRRGTQGVQAFFFIVQCSSSTCLVLSGIFMLVYVDGAYADATAYNIACSFMFLSIAWIAFSLGAIIIYYGTRVITEVQSISISGEASQSTTKRQDIAHRMIVARRLGVIACVTSVVFLLPLCIVFWALGSVPFFFVGALAALTAEGVMFAFVLYFLRRNISVGVSTKQTTGQHHSNTNDQTIPSHEQVGELVSDDLVPSSVVASAS